MFSKTRLSTFLFCWVRISTGKIWIGDDLWIRKNYTTDTPKISTLREFSRQNKPLKGLFGKVKQIFYFFCHNSMVFSTRPTTEKKFFLWLKFGFLLPLSKIVSFKVLNHTQKRRTSSRFESISMIPIDRTHSVYYFSV